MPTLKKILVTMMIVGAVGMTVGAGTFASFNASTTNASSTFTTASIVLERGISGTFCYSNGTTPSGAGASTDTNTNNTCSAMFTASAVKLGDTATTVDLDLVNAGSTAGTLFYKSGGCVNANNGTYYNGAANMCDTTNLTIQEYNDAGRTSAKASCVLPSQPSSSCPAFSATTAPTYTAASLPTTDQSLGSTAATSTRYFRLTIQLPSNTGLSTADDIQGRSASFALSWTLTS